MPTPKIKKKYWSEEVNAWVDENYTSGGVVGINTCKACQQKTPDLKLKFGYCSACCEDMEKADLQLAIRNHIPKDWRIGQFIFNFLEWLGLKGYSSIISNIRMADPFYLSDDKLIKYWFQYIKEIK